MFTDTKQLAKLLTRLGDALEASEKPRKRYEAPVRCQESIPFHDSNIGDILWAGEMDGGIGPNVVIGKDEDGYCLLVAASLPDDCPPFFFYATSRCFPTLREAVVDAANRDLEWLLPLVDWANEAKRATDSAADLDKFADGYDAHEKKNRSHV